MTKIVLDANIIVRFIANDNQKLSPIAKKIIESNECYLDEVILAEVIWVLVSVYEKGNSWIAERMTKFVKMSIIISPRKYLMLSALHLFSTKNLSYIDCWIYVVSQDLGYELKTQDKKLSKLKSP